MDSFEKKVQDARKGQSRPDFKGKARQANWKDGLWGAIRTLAAGEWQDAAVAERLQRVHFERFVTTSLVEAVTSPLSGFRSVVNATVKLGKFPRTIISEDASGRFLAKIVQLFMQRLQETNQHGPQDNIAIVSYPVGRNTQHEEAEAFAAEAMDKAVKRVKGSEPIWFVTDKIFMGSSFGPFLGRFMEALDREEFTRSNASELPSLIVVASTIAEDDISRMFPNAAGAMRLVQLIDERLDELTPISRDLDARAGNKGSALISIETRSEAGTRRTMQQRIAERMFEAYQAVSGADSHMAQ